MTNLDRYYSESVPPSLLPEPDPHITSLVPNSGSAGAGAISVQVNGSHFDPSSVVEVDQVAVTTTFVSSTRLTASFDPSAAGTAMFTVRNANDEESNSVPFSVAAEEEEPPPEPLTTTEEPDQPEPNPQSGSGTGGS